MKKFLFQAVTASVFFWAGTACDYDLNTLRITSFSPGNHSTGIDYDCTVDMVFSAGVNRTDVCNRARRNGEGEVHMEKRLIILIRPQ